LEIEPLRENLRTAEARLRAEPDNGEIRTHHARLAREVANRELQLVRQKADRHPAELGLRLDLGKRLYQAGQIDEAIAELQQARKSPQFKGRALLLLGHCFYSRHNWALAQRNY